MIDGKKIVALVPLRGGSKAIPKKNIKAIAGHPLCFWVLDALLKSQSVDEVYVSTDDDEITSVVQSISPDIGIISRPDELATDDASTESVMLHFAQQVDFDVLVTAQATSPLTTTHDIEKALEIFFKEKCDSLVTGVSERRFYWDKKNDNVLPVNYDYIKRPRRQELEGWITENGAFYITSKPVLSDTHCRLGGKIGLLEMNHDTIVEIDEPLDWKIVEMLLYHRKAKTLVDLIPNVKLLVVDVDGTLTDAGMYYSASGEYLKKFNTRDAKGLELVRKEGIQVCIMTSEDSEIVKARAKKLKIENLYTGISNKLEVLKGISEKLKINLSEMAYIGDDLNDLECLKNVGLAACPLDACEIVKRNVRYICKSPGGKGAVREFCDLLLGSNSS